MSESQSATVHVYHPSGVPVTIPLPVTPELAAELYASVDTLLAAGFRVNLEGLESGEEIKTIDFVSRREHDAGKGKFIWKLDIYIDHPKMENKFHTLYMNNADDIAAWEAATGIPVDSITINDSPDPLKPIAKHFLQSVKRLSPPLRIVVKPNPAYNPTETDPKKKKPKYEFVRYADAPPVTSKPTPAAATSGVDMAAWNEHGVVEAVNDMRDGQPYYPNIVRVFKKRGEAWRFHFARKDEDNGYDWLGSDTKAAFPESVDWYTRSSNGGKQYNGTWLSINEGEYRLIIDSKTGVVTSGIRIDPASISF